MNDRESWACPMCGGPHSIDGPCHGAALDQHATCQHVAYRLTCEEFDAVVERSGGACELCDRTDLRLFIDHVHTDVAYGPVRGLLCPKCNAHMRRIDSGERVPDERVAAYLSRVAP